MLHKFSFSAFIIGVTLSTVYVTASVQELPPCLLLDIQGHHQQLPLSCESRAAVDAAAFYGVMISELEFFDRLPKTDNPHTGFVGDVHDSWGNLPPRGYGVYAEPVAAVLQSYGIHAEPRYGLGLEGLRAELQMGHPVLVWATPRMAAQPVESYVTSDGQTVAVIRYEHTVVAMGYTPYGIYVVDPGSGKRWLYRNQDFLAAWNKLNQMSVVIYNGPADHKGTIYTFDCIRPHPSPTPACTPTPMPLTFSDHLVKRLPLPERQVLKTIMSHNSSALETTNFAEQKQDNHTWRKTNALTPKPK